MLVFVWWKFWSTENILTLEFIFVTVIILPLLSWMVMNSKLLVIYLWRDKTRYSKMSHAVAVSCFLLFLLRLFSLFHPSHQESYQLNNLTSILVNKLRLQNPNSSQTSVLNKCWCSCCLIWNVIKLVAGKEVL